MHLSPSPVHAAAASTSELPSNRPAERRRTARSYLHGYSARGRARRFRVR
ncbi:MAG TPA: hypothetical protein H9827_10875 [Candidatus Luteimonas excrementigallinarum]|nr:hypothetical protein [Candidatus Luteimonas excrementigallinarum]